MLSNQIFFRYCCPRFQSFSSTHAWSSLKDTHKEISILRSYVWEIETEKRETVKCRDFRLVNAQVLIPLPGLDTLHKCSLLTTTVNCISGRQPNWMVFQIPSLCKVVWKRTRCLKIIEKSHFLKRSEGGRRPTERSVFNFFLFLKVRFIIRIPW